MVNFQVSNFQGEIAALSAACLWSIASVLYARLGQRILPVQLNLLKGLIAVTLLAITIFLLGDFDPQIPTSAVVLLLLSGVAGIGLGDIAFLAAINSLGARSVLLIGTLSPPLTAIMAMIFLHETLTFSDWCGIFITIMGVAWVITERSPKTENNQPEENQPVYSWAGISIALLAQVANSIGSLLSRTAFATASIEPLWAALLRLSAAVIFLLAWGWLRTLRGVAFSLDFLQPSQRPIKTLSVAFVAAFCGTYLGIWLQQTAIKLTAVGIATTLLQTSPLFVIPLSIWMGDKVTLRAILGVVVAISGIALLVSSR